MACLSEHIVVLQYPMGMDPGLLADPQTHGCSSLFCKLVQYFHITSPHPPCALIVGDLKYLIQLMLDIIMPRATLFLKDFYYFLFLWLFHLLLVEFVDTEPLATEEDSVWTVSLSSPLPPALLIVPAHALHHPPSPFLNQLSTLSLPFLF